MWTGWCRKMVEIGEIERVAKLMKIDVDDHSVHVDRIKEMIEYFDILDSADIGDQELGPREVAAESLREDRHVPYEGRISEMLSNRKNGYIRAPKMA